MPLERGQPAASTVTVTVAVGAEAVLAAVVVIVCVPENTVLVTGLVTR